MTGLPRQSVWIAALAILALALFGAYEGLTRSSAPDSEEQAVGVGTAMPGNAAAPGAKAATALAEPQPSTAALSESQIRSIVRQEVQAALAPPRAPEPEAPPPGPAPLTLPPPRPLEAPPVVRPPAANDAQADAELLSGAGGGR